jgi:methylglutaconyl-CoA hydratase
MTVEGAKVAYSVLGAVAEVRMNRPAARNALDPESMELLGQALTNAQADDSVRVIVLTGTGNTFSAGADVKAALTQDPEGSAKPGPVVMAELLAQIQDSSKPVIAKVQGHVYGGGNGLVAACDLAVAAEHTRFAFSEVRLGLTPAVISVVCMQKLDRADANELFLLGERVSAQRVLSAGMVNAVVESDALDAVVAGWVSMLSLGGPLALAGTKELIRRVPELDRAQGFEFTAEYSRKYFASPEAVEGMTALLQKRTPNWVPERD